MIEFRDAFPDDRDAVLGFWPHPDRLDNRLAAAATGAESLLVAVMTMAAVGAASIRWAGGCEDPGRPMLYAVEVTPRLRGRGIGTALIRYAAGRVAARGFAELCLEVEVGNSGAVSLYRRLGFHVAGPHRHVWHSENASGAVDVVIMRAQAAEVAAEGRINRR